MPVWVILLLATVVLVVGSAVPVALRVQRGRAESFRAAVADVRARLEALDYRLDALPVGVDAAHAAELRDTAQAMVSVADDRGSARACREAALVTARAEAALAVVSPPGRP